MWGAANTAWSMSVQQSLHCNCWCDHMWQRLKDAIDCAGSRSIQSTILTALEHAGYGIDPSTLELLGANPKKEQLLEAHLNATGGCLDHLQGMWRVIDLGCSTCHTRTSAECVCPTVLASHGDRALYCTHKSVSRSSVEPSRGNANHGV